MLRFNQTLENYLKVSVGSGTYKITKDDELQITNSTEFKSPIIGNDLLQKRDIKCINKNNDSKFGNSIKSTITNSSTGHSGVTSLPPIGNSFLYIETSSNIQ